MRGDAPLTAIGDLLEAGYVLDDRTRRELIALFKPEPGSDVKLTLTRTKQGRPLETRHPNLHQALVAYFALLDDGAFEEAACVEVCDRLELGKSTLRKEAALYKKQDLHHLFRVQRAAEKLVKEQGLDHATAYQQASAADSWGSQFMLPGGYPPIPLPENDRILWSFFL